MGLEKIELHNKGMSRDLSISKESNEFAYENHNIRIQSTDNETLLSVTNVKGPKKMNLTIWKNGNQQSYTDIQGSIIGRCLAGDYLVLFALDKSNYSNPAKIYRINLKTIKENSQGDFSCDVVVLYNGSNANLKFSTDQHLDTLFYYEAFNIQKVYWTNGWNDNPRVINITKGEIDNVGHNTYYTSDDDFAFYPQIKKVPTIKVEKQRTQLSRLPVGVIQYFVSYFNSNGAETLVANATSLLSVDLENRGAPADTTTNDCSFKVTLSNVDTQFDYVRVYSAIRTSSEAAVNAYIVRDIKIDKNNSAATYSFVDNGTNNETIQDSQLIFIGGQPFFAKTLTQKDDTIFFGNLKTERKYLDAELKGALHPAKDTTAPKINLSFGTKTFIPKSPEIGAFYPYRLQKDLPSIDYRTFKAGETYRFGIQFQDKQGVWSDVEWIGDLEQTTFPSYNETTGEYTVASAMTTGLDSSIQTLASNKGYINYRLLMADPRFSNGRKILAQGIVCPTMFNATQRASGSVYAFPSWVMRPNKGPLPHHHLEALDNPEEDRNTAEVQYDNTHKDENKKRVYNTPDIDKSQSENFYITIMGVGGGKHLFYAIYKISNTPLAGTSDYPLNYIDTNLFKNSGSTSSPSFTPVITSENCTLIYGRWFIDGTWGGYLDDIKAKLTAKAPDYPQETLPTVSELVKLASGINVGAQPVKAVLKAAISGVLPEGIKYSEDESFNGVTTKLAERNWCRWGAFQNHYSDNYFAYKDGAKRYYIFNSSSSTDENHKNFMFFANDYAPDTIYNGRQWFLYPYPIPYIDGGDLKKEVPFVLPEALNQAINTEGIQYLVHNFSDINDPDNTKDDNCAFKGEMKNKQIFVQVVFPGLYGKKGEGDFFIDSSIISMHSPEIIDNPSLFENKNCRFNIVGLINFEKSYADINTEFKTPSYISDRGGFDDTYLYKYRTSLEYNPLISDYFYIDGTFKEIQSEDKGTGKWFLSPATASKYKLFLFNQSKSIIGTTNQDFLPTIQYGNADKTSSELISILYGTLKSKTIFNHNFTQTKYKSNNSPAYLNFTPTFIEYVDNNFVPIKRNLNSMYQGNLDTLIASDDIPIIVYPNTKLQKQFGGSVRIKFDSTQHAVLDLGKSGNKYRILPRLDGEDSYYHFRNGLANGYNAKTNFGNIWGDSYYKLGSINCYDDYAQTVSGIPSSILSTSYPYLYIGEIVQDISPSDLYGGISDDALKKLIWIPISETTPLDKSVKKTDGDTYYQRWDCLKTYPSAEEDLNKVVDITSFMVESHINLDERTDRNRGNFNIMSRPTNFNLFNPVYSQLNNLFSYSIEGNELTTETYPTQYTWSLIKNKNALVDSWTNVTLTSLGTCKYPITKLDTFNHNILALTEHSIEQIAFNARTMVQTDGLPVEILNSSKVTGTIQLQYPYGTYNMSTLTTEQGLYFIEDNDKSIIRIGLDGAFKKLGVITMGDWMKNNITQGTYTPDFTEPFHMEYDSIHKDIYFINSKYCLVYNETLDSFTSFMDYTNMDVLYNYGGNTYAIALKGNHTMFEGKYNTTFNEQPIGYSVEYRINTKPLEDKVFTNLDFIADNETVNTEPFDYIHAWNEYQDTTNVPLIYLRNMPSNFKQKFRVWRADIPRDGNKKLAGNRLRNPWLNFKLSKSTNNLPNELMTFHNITVQYLR